MRPAGTPGSLAPITAVLALILPGTALIARAGVVVEGFEQGGTAEAAGVRVGDLILSWDRAPCPGSARPGDSPGSPGIPERCSGEFRSVLDVVDVGLEQVPRGRITLNGDRPEGRFSVTPAPGPWGMRVRPPFSGEVLEAYRGAESSAGTLDGQDAASRLEQLSNAAGVGAADGAWMLHRAAARLVQGGRWEEARRSFDRAAERAAAGADPDSPAALRLLEGDLFHDADRFDDAERAYGDALSVYRRLSPGSLSVAAAQFRLGKVALARRDLRSAEALFHESLRLRESLAPGSLEVAQVLDSLGITLGRRDGTGDLEQAESFHRRALGLLLEVAPESAETARALNGLGIIARKRNDLASAEKYFQDSLALYVRAAPGTRGHAAALYNLGQVARNRGDPTVAEAYYRRALEIEERLAPESLAVSRSLNSLGLIAKEKGDLATAEDLHRRALAIRQRLAPTGAETAASLNNLGSVAFARRDLTSAEEYFRRALDLWERAAPDSLGMAISLSNVGVVAFRRGDLASAREHHQRSLAIKEALAPDSIALAKELINLGETEQARGSLDSAEELFRRALAIGERLAPGSLSVADSLYDLGLLAEQRGDSAAAREHHGRALAICERLAPGSHMVADLASALARLHRRAGDPPTALAYYEKAVGALETQQDRLGGVEEARTAFRSGSAGIFREMIDLLVELRRPEEAFHLVERSRARGLLDMLARRDLVLSDGIPEELERRRRLLAAEYDQELERLGDLPEGAEDAEVKSRRAGLQALRRRQQETREEIIRSSPRVAGLRYAVPLDVAGARRALDPGTAVLSYSVGTETTLLFALDREGPLAVERSAAGAGALGDLVREFRAAIVESRDASSTGTFNRTGRRLYELLIAPVAGRLGAADRLLIVPDGPLHLLPFAALIRPAAGDRGRPRYLVEWKPLHLAASVTVYDHLRKSRPGRKAARPPVLLAFGDPAYPPSEGGSESGSGDPILRSVLARGRSFTPLPASRGEVTAITSLYGDAATALLGEMATEERARSAGTGPTLIHIAAHGLVDEEFPLDSAIALSLPGKPLAGRENGLLQAWEIFESMRIDADLVTLSACETGLGRELAGEGIVGLTRAFQYAGARTVLASLWNVADRSTADLMKRFYRHLKRGADKDEALRLAQIDLIRGRSSAEGEGPEGERGVGRLAKGPSPGSRASPFHWAAFALFGDWR
jgi:CHAT domain-containing protein/Tfp pilus assembly protein PilF